jgi:Phosphotransferase enzyme family
MIARKALPDDPALPALASIREIGLAATIPALGLGRGPVELRLCGYTPGSRATLEARAAGRHFTVKAYANDPAPEVKAYEALAAAGLAGESGPRVPRLLAWDRTNRALALTWLDGVPLNQLIKTGQGRRAGEMAALWFRRAGSRSLRMGPPLGPGEVLFRSGLSVARLGVADPALGAAAERVAAALQQAEPHDGHSRLVHGTLYARHILDLGDGPGVIDWQQFGQGPVEVDAGMFLATVSRLAVRHRPAADEAARAEEAFLAGTRDWVDDRALAWYRAAGLLHVASRGLRRRRTVEAGPLVDEAAQWAEYAVRDRWVSDDRSWPRLRHLRIALRG